MEYVIETLGTWPGAFFVTKGNLTKKLVTAFNGL